MTIKRFRMTVEVFAGLFQAGLHNAYRVIEGELPKNIRIEDVRIRYLDSGKDGPVLEFLLSSPDFSVDGEDVVPVMEWVYVEEVR